MKNNVRAFATFAVIFLILSVPFEHIIVLTVNGPSVPPPRQPVNLRELVEALTATTPLENRSDIDNDGILDSVEAVIGTDFNNTDSDFDRLSDTYEVWNATDPLDPDSNSDGLPDYYEVINVKSMDVDGDGITNAWDFDNDGDLVNDNIDISPFSSSTTHESFHLNIETNGNPLYITFQLKPKDPDHLKLFGQSWDWPYDKEGSMKDQDNSKEDVTILPYLNLTVNSSPDQLDVALYGILVTSNSVLIPLLPVLEYGNIVAFTGKMLYPSTSPPSLFMDAELIWRVFGMNDEKANALQAFNGGYVSLASSGEMVANASEISLEETFQWFELGEETVAMKALNGMFLSVAPDGSVIANGSEIGDHESFKFVNLGGNSMGLKAINGLYVSISADGTLVANSEGAIAFTLVDRGYLPEKTILATYGEAFMLTGLSVEEAYGCDVGLFYSGDVNQTVAANLVLAYQFLRNSTTTVLDIQSILAGYNVNVTYQLGNFSHRDVALEAIANVMTPIALDSLSANRTLPVVTIFRESSVTLELSQFAAPCITASSFTIDLAAGSVVTTKTLKTNWHNTTSYDALTIDEIMTNINGYDLSDNATYALMTLMLYWNTGEQRINGTLDPVTELSDLEFIADTVGDIVQGSLTGLSGLYRGVLGLAGLVGYSHIDLLMKKGWNLKSITRFLGKKWATTPFKQWVAICSKLQKTKSFFKGWNKVLKGLDFIALFADVGFSIHSVFVIAESTDLGAFGTNVALLKTTMRLVFNIMLFAIAEIPYVGWLISLVIALSDVLGGWSDAFFDWLISMMSRVSGQVTPDLEIVGNPKITTYDKDNNGLDVGDRVEYMSRLKGTVLGSDWSLVSDSAIYPYYVISAPPGSNSTTGFLYPSAYPAPPYRQYGLWDSVWYHGGIYRGAISHFPLPPSNQMTWTGSSSAGWRAVEYETGVWIEPGIGMINFPVNIKLDTFSTLEYRWEHFVFLLVYGFWCDHEDVTLGVNNVGSFNLYFDVLPGNIADFVSWRSIIPLDHDGDGLEDSNETMSDPWRFDTDADGLNDKYENDIGTDPRSYDTDRDGLVDWYELVYATNATEKDSDGDGLDDFLEVAGWVITFNYFGQNFTVQVVADPLVQDSDGDGLDDNVEYMSGLNPRSKDTDGNGVNDIPNPRLDDTYLEFVKQIEIPLGMSGESGASVTDIAIDTEGYIYATSSNYKVYKFDSNLTLISSQSFFSTPEYFNDFDEEGNFYILRRGNYEAYYDVPYFPGYEVKSVGASWVEIYDSNRTLIDTWGNFTNRVFTYWRDPPTGGSPYSWYYRWSYDANMSKFNWVNDLAIDNANHYLYISEVGATEYTYKVNYPSGDELINSTKLRPDRVAIYRNDGTYVRSLLEFNNGSLRIEFNNPTGLEVDEEGYLYVCDSGNNRIHKFDSNGRSIASWEIISVSGIVADAEGNLYPYTSYLNGTHYGFGVIYKFSQMMKPTQPEEDVVSDRDGDGLLSALENAGWDLTVTNFTSTFTVHVTSDPLINDTDFDGLSDYQEYNMATNPRNPDTDDDGLSDLAEWRGFSPKTDPNHFDTDLDQLPDGIELTFGSDPNKEDTDDDGLSDLVEFELNSNPASKDTDMDGLEDAIEASFNSNLLSPDSDGDFMFDCMEHLLGTEPQDNDTDGDGLNDGFEVLYNTSPLSNDTDGDNIIDTLEIELRLNPTSNDTDGDGVLDFSELEGGTNPWSNDTDWDGIPDNLDADSNMTQVSSLVLAYDQSPAATEFASNLEQYTNVTAVSLQQLLQNYTDSPRIVLIGSPEATNGSVGNLIHDLLSDSGDVLTSMMASNGSRFAIRYGVWNSTQTAVMLSHPYVMDHLFVLEILRSKNVTILPDSVIVDYNLDTAVAYPSGGSLNHTAGSYNFFKVDEIDTVKATDSKIYATLEESVNLTMTITRYNATTTPYNLTQTSGLALYEKSVGNYLNITASENVQNVTGDIVDQALIQIYYRETDLDKTGDGDALDPEDFNEATLTMYFFDESLGQWVKLTSDLSWVIDVGVNTTDIELYGESYGGFVWATVRHFSFYGLAALPFNRSPIVSDAYPSMETLWPANHKFIDVTILGVTDPDGDDVTITITDITCDEVTEDMKGVGGKRHAPDAYGVGTNIVSLRAERSGRDNGRVYVITFVASDGRGGETVGSTIAYVPHDKKVEALDDGQ